MKKVFALVLLLVMVSYSFGQPPVPNGQYGAPNVKYGAPAQPERYVQPQYQYQAPSVTLPPPQVNVQDAAPNVNATPAPQTNVQLPPAQVNVQQSAPNVNVLPPVTQRAVFEAPPPVYSSAPTVSYSAPLYSARVSYSAPLYSARVSYSAAPVCVHAPVQRTVYSAPAVTYSAPMTVTYAAPAYAVVPALSSNDRLHAKYGLLGRLRRVDASGPGGTAAAAALHRRN